VIELPSISRHQLPIMKADHTRAQAVAQADCSDIDQHVGVDDHRHESRSASSV
jgi:hypothetical protein